ncbi:MAG: winged helix-turn-helix transcriptional regulator [Prolixibacteraceae bacterium]|nr:winged helix-turn-helix transcriptional regulator [Prolixibacteraceae bacterium]
MIKKDRFNNDLQQLAAFAKVLAHPARLAILQFLSQSKTCISGDISEHLPLSRTTVSQHLSELKKLGLIHGEIEGTKVNYCLCSSSIASFLTKMEAFFEPIKNCEMSCETNHE